VRGGGVALVALCAALAGAALGGACSQTHTVPAWQRDQPRKNEITALWTQIREWRREAGMDVEPTKQLVLEARRMSASSVHHAKLCPNRPPPAACDDVCGLADAICENAESICALADELQPDDWSKDKCDSAKASCREAKQRCCACDDRAEDSE
jgi:hypothetical protein